MILTAYCDNLDFVSTLYHTLLRYAMSNAFNKQFVDDWIDFTYNNDVIELESDEEKAQFFVDLVKSPIIEEFYDNRYVFELRDLKTKYRKQINYKLQDYDFLEADSSEVIKMMANISPPA